MQTSEAMASGLLLRKCGCGNHALAPVAGRGANGACIYSGGHVLPHVGRDLLGLRNFELFPPPSGEPRPGDVQSALGISIPGS